MKYIQFSQSHIMDMHAHACMLQKVVQHDPGSLHPCLSNEGWLLARREEAERGAAPKRTHTRHHTSSKTYWSGMVKVRGKMEYRLSKKRWCGQKRIRKDASEDKYIQNMPATSHPFRCCSPRSSLSSPRFWFDLIPKMSHRDLRV